MNYSSSDRKGLTTIWHESVQLAKVSMVFERRKPTSTLKLVGNLLSIPAFTLSL